MSQLKKKHEHFHLINSVEIVRSNYVTNETKKFIFLRCFIKKPISNYLSELFDKNNLFSL